MDETVTGTVEQAVEAAITDTVGESVLMTDGNQADLPSVPATVPDTGPTEDLNAHSHTRAREATTIPAITLRERVGLRRRVRAFVVYVPEIWERPRPSLKELVDYARQAPWTGGGLPGWLGKAWACLVAVPAHALTYLTLWVLQRPARAVCGAVLGVLVLEWTPPGQWLVGFVADVARLFVT